jgi:hypothetical protein
VAGEVGMRKFAFSVSIVFYLIASITYAYALPSKNEVEQRLIADDFSKWVYDETRTNTWTLGVNDNPHCLYDSMQFLHDHKVKIVDRNGTGKRVETVKDWNVLVDRPKADIILTIGSKKYFLKLSKSDNTNQFIRLDQIISSRDQYQYKVVYKLVKSHK